MFFRSIRMDLKSSTVLLLIPLRIYFITDERFSNLNVSVKLIIHCTKKWSFLLRISSMWPNPQESVDLVTFTGETLNGKHFFCAVMVIYSPYASLITNHVSVGLFSYKPTQYPKIFFCNIVGIDLFALRKTKVS